MSSEYQPEQQPNWFQRTTLGIANWLWSLIVLLLLLWLAYRAGYLNEIANTGAKTVNVSFANPPRPVDLGTPVSANLPGFSVNP